MNHKGLLKVEDYFW